MMNVDRFWSKVDCGTDDECWEWQGAINSCGYGNLRVNYKTKVAHRVAYELECGAIPEGYVIHHKCNNPKCVNPYHLQTLSINTHTLIGNSPSAQSARKTHCKKGHPLSGDNLYVSPDNHRHCRLCGRLKKK